MAALARDHRAVPGRFVRTAHRGRRCGFRGSDATRREKTLRDKFHVMGSDARHASPCNRCGRNSPGGYDSSDLILFMRTARTFPAMAIALILQLSISPLIFLDAQTSKSNPRSAANNEPPRTFP